VIVDARGRLFGRVNLVDAAAIALVLLLIPVAVVSWRVFRVPVPSVSSIEPAVQDWRPTNLRIKVHGQHLRPYLTFFINRPDEPFFVDNRMPATKMAPVVTVTPTFVEVRVPDVRPGVYDLYLFDQSQMLQHLPRAFTLAVPATKAMLEVTVRVVVVPELAALIRPGDEDRFTSQYVAEGMPNATVRSVSVRPDPVERMELFPSRDGRMWLGGTGGGRAVDVTLHVPATNNAGGRWEYKGQRIVPGEFIAFETAAYVVRGTILTLTEIPTAGQ
jgi:hypothetical protein